MNRVAAALVACAVFACGVKPATRRDPIAPEGRPSRPFLRWKPRFELASIAPATNVKQPWPLTSAPMREPHHRAAGGDERCTPAWKKAHSAKRVLLEYATAWCTMSSDEDGAIAALAKLANAHATESIGVDARWDVIDRIAAKMTADTAVVRLHAIGFDRPEDRDRLAATFAAIDKRADALVVALAFPESEPQRDAIARCERLLAWGELDTSATATLAEVVDVLDDDCARRAGVATCALARSDPEQRTDSTGARLVAIRECYNEYPDDNVDARAWFLIAARRWSAAGPPSDWVDLARDAENALGIHGGEEFAVAALENALASTECIDAELATIVVAAATRVAGSPHHTRLFDERLARLQAIKPTCN